MLSQHQGPFLRYRSKKRVHSVSKEQHRHSQVLEVDSSELSSRPQEELRKGKLRFLEAALKLQQNPLEVPYLVQLDKRQPQLPPQVEVFLERLPHNQPPEAAVSSELNRKLLLQQAGPSSELNQAQFQLKVVDSLALNQLLLQPKVDFLVANLEDVLDLKQVPLPVPLP